MERPDIGDWVHVMHWCHASRHHFETIRPKLSRLEVIEAAEQDCYHQSPYGKRYAVHQLGVDRDQLPMPEFTLEDESAFHRYVDSKQQEAESQRGIFNYEVEGRAEIRWIEAWHHHGVQLLPDPVAPEPESVIVENSVDDNLLNNEVYYSSFLSDDIARSAVS